MGRTGAALVLGRVPAGCRRWVAAPSPYAEHLVRDVGMLSVSTAVVLAAAMTLEPRLVAIALLAVLTFEVPHALWHLAHLEPFGTADAVAQVAYDAIVIAVALACLRWSRRRLRPSR